MIKVIKVIIKVDFRDMMKKALVKKFDIIFLVIFSHLLRRLFQLIDIVHIRLFKYTSTF